MTCVVRQTCLYRRLFGHITGTNSEVMPIHMPIHMSIHMPMHMPIHKPAHMSIHMSIHMPIHMFTHTCVCTCLHTCLYTCLCTCRCTCLYAHAWTHTSRHEHLQVGLMSVGHVCLYHILSRGLVLEPQLDQKKVSASGFLHCRAQGKSKGPFPSNLGSWLHDFKVDTPIGSKKNTFSR